MSNLVYPRAYNELILNPYGNSNTQTASFFGDIHLNNFIESLEQVERHSNIFAEHLHENVVSKSKQRGEKNEDLLVINGDFFDFSESFVWRFEERPFDDTRNGHFKALSVFNSIKELHQPTVKQINEFLNSKKNARVVFTFGNHDHILLVDDKLRSEFQKMFLPEANDEERNERVQFTKSLKLPALKTQVEHGHRIDKFDFSKGREHNDGDQLSYVKIMVIKNIIKRLMELDSQQKIPSKLAKKMIDEVMKVDYIRDAKAFPLYLKKLAQKYYKKHKDRFGEQIAKEIFKAIMKYKEDFLNLIYQTPLLGMLGNLPKKMLKNKLFEEFFVLRMQYIYNKLTHKNTLQRDDAILLHQEDPNYTKFIRGHTHIFGTEFHNNGSDDTDTQTIEAINHGSWIPIKRYQQSGWRPFRRGYFDKTRSSESGVVIRGDLNATNGDAIKVTSHNVSRSYSSR